MLNTNEIIDIFNNYSHLAIPISLLISIAISLAGVLPSIFVTGANIIFFGPIKGFMISLLGETLGAYITFTLYRYGFKKKFDKFASKYEFYEKLVNSNDKYAGILIVQGRILPFIPSGIVTLAASLSNVKSSVFTIATFIGKAPSIALEALVSYDIINFNTNWIRLVATICALIVIKIVLSKSK